MNRSRIIVVLALSISATGCAITQEVRSVENSIGSGSLICIEENPSVKERDILEVIKQSMIRNNYETEIHSKVPQKCEYKITYVAYQKWDFSTFLSQATIKLYQGTMLIGSVEYKTPGGVFGGGGANPKKWGSTESKISPLMDQLFEM